MHIFSNQFDKAKWQMFLKDYFKNSELYRDLKKVALDNNSFNISYGEQFGLFDTEDGKRIGFYYVELPGEINLSRNKVSLRNMLGNIYKYNDDAILVVFNQPDKKIWRLSYVSDTKTYGITNSTRYTYLVGENQHVKTVKSRFEILKNKNHVSLKDLSEVFSVEALTKEFFNKIFGWYKNALEEVSFLLHSKKIKKLTIQQCSLG